MPSFQMDVRLYQLDATTCAKVMHSCVTAKHTGSSAVRIRCGRAQHLHAYQALQLLQGDHRCITSPAATTHPVLEARLLVHVHD